MNLPRIEQLQKFLKEDPSDPFTWYALALEYQKEDPGTALNLFEKLLSDFEHYLPAYYQTAHLFLHFDQSEKAIKILEKGILLARQQNDLKTMAELRAMLDEL